MRKPLIVITSFAFCGFLLAAAIYGYYSYFYDFTKTTALDVVADIVTIMLCPPSLLSLACIDCEVGTGAGLVWFSFIALINGGLYAGIGLSCCGIGSTTATPNAQVAKNLHITH